MKRRFTFGTLMALVMILGITVTAMAAGPGQTTENVGAAGLASQGAALHDTYVDADGDGICDNYADRAQPQDGTGNQWNGRQGQQAGMGSPGANFVDVDGDGVCDTCEGDGTHPQDGIDQQMRQGGRLNK